MQVVLPGVMRYSEPVAGAHLSGPAEVPQREILLDRIRAAAKISAFARNLLSHIISAAQCRSSAAAPAIPPGRRPRPAVQLYFGCAHSTSMTRKPHDSNHRRSNRKTTARFRGNATRKRRDGAVPPRQHRHGGSGHAGLRHRRSHRRARLPADGRVPAVRGRPPAHRRPGPRVRTAQGRPDRRHRRRQRQRQAGEAGGQAGSGGTGGGNGQRARTAGLAGVTAVNGLPPDEARARRHFDDLTPVYPHRAVPPRRRRPLPRGADHRPRLPHRQGPARPHRRPAQGGQDHGAEDDRARHRHRLPGRAPHAGAGRRAPGRGHRPAPLGPRRGHLVHLRPVPGRPRAGGRARHRAGQAAGRTRPGRRGHARLAHPARPRLQPGRPRPAAAPCPAGSRPRRCSRPASSSARPAAWRRAAR